MESRSCLLACRKIASNIYVRRVTGNCTQSQTGSKMHPIASVHAAMKLRSGRQASSPGAVYATRKPKWASRFGSVRTSRQSARATSVGHVRRDLYQSSGRAKLSDVSVSVARQAKKW